VPYYHELITRKSREELERLRRLMDFVLIGGWAVYFYTHSLKSKDIDILVDYSQLPVLQKHYRLVKNSRLKKYEALRDEVEIDIYLPHYSALGIEVSELRRHTRSVEGFTLLDSHYLTALKIYTLSERARSAKGEKDFIDILSLVHWGGIDLAAVKNLMQTHALASRIPLFLTLLSEHSEVPELGMTRHAYARLKKLILGSLGP